MASGKTVLVLGGSIVAAMRLRSGEGQCFVETGDGRAGYGGGNFYADPTPQIALKPPSMLMHWGKVAYEKYWLWSRF